MKWPKHVVDTLLYITNIVVLLTAIPSVIDLLHYKTEPVEKNPAVWTHNLQPRYRPTTCKPKAYTSYSLAHILIRHLAHTRLPLNLLAGYLALRYKPT